MPRYVFRDFDEFAASIAGIAGQFVPTAQSSAEWWLEATRIDRLSLQQIQVGGPATFAGDGEPGSLTLAIPMTSPQRIRLDGDALSSTSFILLKQDRPFTCTAQAVTRWAGVTVPADHGLLASQLVEQAPSSERPLVHTDQVRLEHLRWLIARVLSGGPGIDLSDCAAASSAEQEIAMAAIHALEASLSVDTRRAGRRQSRQRIIARALELIEAHQGHPLFVGDLCRAAGVSERTLRNAFSDYFGVGPIRLLKVRQLREIRTALLAADPAHDTVAGIAGRFGVWDFSLFARNYKKLFGESPSNTLRIRAGSCDGGGSLSWLRYAVKQFVEETPRAATGQPPPAGFPRNRSSDPASCSGRAGDFVGCSETGAHE